MDAVKDPRAELEKQVEKLLRHELDTADAFKKIFTMRYDPEAFVDETATEAAPAREAAQTQLEVHENVVINLKENIMEIWGEGHRLSGVAEALGQTRHVTSLKKVLKRAEILYMHCEMDLEMTTKLSMMDFFSRFLEPSAADDEALADLHEVKDLPNAEDRMHAFIEEMTFRVQTLQDAHQRVNEENGLSAYIQDFSAFEFNRLEKALAQFHAQAETKH